MVGVFLLALLPSFLQVPLRRLLGQSIGKGSKVKFGTILKSAKVEIGNNCIIGPFSFVRAQEIAIGEGSVIKPLSYVSTRIVKLGKYVHIAPLAAITSEFAEDSKFEAGDHSRIFPFCWIDTSHGVFLGNNVGVGGHSLIFTHGIWPDYIDGGPVAFGPVIIKDRVWLPWRVFILPNVQIGEDSVVAGGSVVNKQFPANSLLGGVPAKLIRENVIQNLTGTEKITRVNEVLTAYSRDLNFKHGVKSIFDNGSLFLNDNKIVVDNTTELKDSDILIIVNKDISNEQRKELINKGVQLIDHKNKTLAGKGSREVFKGFVPFLRQYGIRLYID